jgi:hypothetical protein
MVVVPVMLLHVIETAIACILCMSLYKEDCIDSLKITHFNNVRNNTKDNIILVLSAAVVEHKIQFLTGDSIRAFNQLKPLQCFHYEGSNIVPTLCIYTFFINMSIEMIIVAGIKYLQHHRH